MRCSGPRSTLIASWNCRPAAVVKNSDPTKNVTPIAGRGADAHYDAIAATAKQDDPIPNSTPIHQPMRSGRHQTPVRTVCARAGTSA